MLSLATGFAIYTAMDKTENLVPVVVATQNIAPNTVITEAMVKTDKIPALGRSENALDEESLVVGGFTTTQVYAGQTFVQPMVAKQFDASGMSGLALTIPDENLRAYSVPIQAGYAVGDKLQKGDHVDIIATMNVGGGKNGGTITKTIMQNVRIFDVDRGRKDDKEIEHGPIKQISFLLTLEQIEIIKHAASLGDLSVALNPGNPNRKSTRGVINETLCTRYNFSGCTNIGK